MLDGTSRLGNRAIPMVHIRIISTQTVISAANNPRLDFFASSALLADAKRCIMFWSPNSREMVGIM